MPEHSHRKNDRQADRFKPVYVLLGDDGRAADEFIQELKKKLVAPGFEAFDLEEFHAEDVPVQQALQHLRQPPVGSARRLVVIRAAEVLSKSAFDELCHGLARLPAEGSTAVLTCRWSRNVADVIAGAGLGRFVVSLRPPQGQELVARIRNWATGMGFALEPDAVELLVELAGDDTTLLWGELEKLATAVEPGARVDAALVRQLAGRSRDFELNEYVFSLAEGNLPRALEVLARLAAWGEQPQQIVGWLVTSLLKRAEDLTHRPEGRQAALAYLRRTMHQLYDVNRAFLSGHPEPFVLLEMFTVCACCTGHGRACRLDGREPAPAFCMRGRYWRPGGRRGIAAPTLAQ